MVTFLSNAIIPKHVPSKPLPAVGTISWYYAQTNAQQSDIATYTTRLKEIELMRKREDAILKLIPARVAELNNLYEQLVAFKRKLWQVPRMFCIKTTEFEVEFFALKNPCPMVTTALRDRAGTAVNDLWRRLREKERQEIQCDLKLEELQEQSKMLSENRDICRKILVQLRNAISVYLRS